MRKLILAIMALALVVLAGFWLVSAPRVIAATELPAHSPTSPTSR